MKVIALIEGPDHVCYRYRIEPFAWALWQRGLSLEAAPLSRRTLARIAQCRAAGSAGTVILQRKLLPVWQVALLRRYARRLIYDFDDAVFRRDSYSPKGPRSRTRLIRFWATVLAADTVTAGNEYLKSAASAYIEPERIHVIPTCVEPRLYPPSRHQRTGSQARLVWIGQACTLASLTRAQEHLAAAGSRLPGLQLRLICDRPVRLPQVDVVLRRWSKATEHIELSSGDIGISWLPDDSWSRGKCGLKVLQYMAAGLPVVANPVGMNLDMVVSGETGFLASTPGEWAQAIFRLASDPELRRMMGAAGRRLVERRYSVRRWSDTFADAVAASAYGQSGRNRAGAPVGPRCLAEAVPPVLGELMQPVATAVGKHSD